MQYCRMERIVTDSYSIPDGEIFTVLNSEKETWAFAMRLGKKFTLTRFQSHKVDAGGVRHAHKQIMFCKTYGWSYTGNKTWNTEVDDHEPEFVCMYCNRTTYDISEPCPCRNKKTEDFLKKTEHGIILPF